MVSQRPIPAKSFITWVSPDVFIFVSQRADLNFIHTLEVHCLE